MQIFLLLNLCCTLLHDVKSPNENFGLSTALSTFVLLCLHIEKSDSKTQIVTKNRLSITDLTLWQTCSSIFCTLPVNRKAIKICT